MYIRPLLYGCLGGVATVVLILAFVSVAKISESCTPPVLQGYSWKSHHGVIYICFGGLRHTCSVQGYANLATGVTSSFLSW